MWRYLVTACVSFIFSHSSSILRHTYPSMWIPPFSTSPISHYSSRVQSPSTLPSFLFLLLKLFFCLGSRLVNSIIYKLRDPSSRTLIDMYFGRISLLCPLFFRLLSPSFLVGVSCNFVPAR